MPRRSRLPQLPFNRALLQAPLCVGLAVGLLTSSWTWVLVAALLSVTAMEAVALALFAVAKPLGAPGLREHSVWSAFVSLNRGPSRC